MINYIKATIKFNTVYECAKCNTKEVGETVRVDVSALSTMDLKETLDNIRQTSAHMPVGWGYDGEFYCGCRKGE